MGLLRGDAAVQVVGRARCLSERRPWSPLVEVQPTRGTKPSGGEMGIHRLCRDCWGDWQRAGISGDPPAWGGWGSLSSRGWKRIAAGNRGKVFSSPTDVQVWGRCWQQVRRSKNSLEQRPEQPRLRLSSAGSEQDFGLDDLWRSPPTQIIL